MSEYLEKARQILSRSQGLADTGSPQPEEAIAAAESALSVKFPDSYRQYLKDWGWVSFGPNEYMGLGSSVHSVVSATERIRRDRALPRDFVVVCSHEDDEFVCLDTSRMQEGECPVVVWDSSSQAISRPRASDFGQFLESDLRAFVG